MKNIIKTAFCLIVISSILLYSSVSKAESANLSISSPSTVSSVLIDSYTREEENQNYFYYTYEASFSAQLLVNSDAFIYGRYQFYFTVNPQAITGYSVVGTEFLYDPIVNESLISYSFKSGPDNLYNVFHINVLFDNYFVSNRVGLGNVIYRVTLRSLNAPQNTCPLINISATQAANITSISSSAQTTAGMGNIIKMAITDALQNSQLNSVYSLLSLWKTTQDGYLADIELSIDDVETWLAYINSAQATLQNKVDLIYVLEQTFPGYFNSMISLLQQIRDMNASDTAAESQMQNAEQQLSQAVNDMEVQKPNINNVVNAGDQYMDSNITGAQGDTFFWLHGTNIFVTILTMAVTIGILGFVIYGKSG